MPVDLSKEKKVNLKKPDVSQNRDILINLNWQQGPNAVDLDLACLYELTDGVCGGVQAVNGLFGDLQAPPYIFLDHDDRTGANAAGETLRINARQVNSIKRVLVYAFIYSGITNWQETRGRVTVYCPGNEDVTARIDEVSTTRQVCAIAMLENNGNGSFSVQKEMLFFDNQPSMSDTFHWGLKWNPGEKKD